MVLGATFNFGVFIGYAALAKSATVAWPVAMPFYIGGILWTIVYDSIYAFQDREFDKKLNLSSTAIAMEHNPYGILSALASASVGCFALGGITAGLGLPYYLSLLGVSGHYTWQIKTLDIESRESCWNRFQSNKWLGFILAAGILAGKTTKKTDEVSI